MTPLIAKNKALKAIHDQEGLVKQMKSVLKEIELTKEETTTLVKEMEEKVKIIDGAIKEAKELNPNLESKFDKLSDEIVSALKDIKTSGLKGDKGDKGQDGNTVDAQAIERNILSKVPKTEDLLNKLPKEQEIIRKVLGQIPENKPSLKVIQESIDIDAVAEKVKKEISIEDLKDWKDKLQNIRLDISRAKPYYQVAGAGGGNNNGGGSPAANEFNYIISRSGANTIAYDVANSTILSTNTAPNVPIQAAVDAAAAAGGGIIGIKAGTYLISGSGTEVNMKSNVHIVGAGKGATIIQCDTFAGAAFRKITTAIASNFSLRDMTIDGLSSAGVSAFLGEYMENVEFTNLEVLNIGLPNATETAGSFKIGRSYNITTLGTTDFTLIGAASNTVGLRFNPTGVGTGTGTATLIDNTTGFGLHIGQFALPPYTQTIVNRDIRIDNCSFDGFYSTNEEILTFNSERVQITDCTFGENAVGQGPGIGIFQWIEDIEVTGCTFREINGPSIYYSLSCNNINIHDNFFFGTQQAIMGAALSDSDKSPNEFNVHKVNGLRVAGNYFKNNSTGVQIGSTDGAIIDGNVFEELENMPILINFGTTVYTLALGTRTMATNFKITNNIFKNNNQEAIDFFANSGMLFNQADGDFYGEIDGNTFYDSNEGVTVTAGDFVVGDRYTINTLGTTDFTLIGAEYNIVGVTFTATGAGTGTGTAIITTQRACITFEGYYKVPAGAFEIGSIYGILPTGFGVTSADTDFTLIGAANNNNGTIFTATGIGSGVGNAMEGTGSADATTLVAGTYYAIMTIGNTDFTLAGASNKYTAGDFKIGREYEIFTIGTTDFTLIGAASNTVGLTFTATGVGTGTGTAVTIGDIFKATGTTTGTGTVLIVKRLNFNSLVIKDNRLQSNGTLVNAPIQLLNGAILGENVVNQNNWNVNPENFYDHETVSGTVVVNRKDGETQKYRISGNIDISIADGISKGDKLSIMIKQGSINPYTATWGGTNIEWASGTAPVLQSSLSVTETFDFVWDDTDWVQTGGSSKIRQSNDVFTITSPDTPTTAGSFVVGDRYTIDSIGTTDFTLIGASANTVGVTFTATDGSPQIATSLVAGRPYVIYFLGTTDFTLIGAASNTLGQAFTATGAGTGSGLAYIDGRGLGTGVGLLQYTRLYTLDPETATTIQTARFLATLADTLKLTKIIE